MLAPGLKRGDLVIVAARPSLGKTSLVLNFARNAALKHNATVGFFSVEMAADQLVQRTPQGSSIKFLARYREPFWRAKGYSGQMVADMGPVQLLFDDGFPGEGDAVADAGLGDLCAPQTTKRTHFGDHLVGQVGARRDPVARATATMPRALAPAD